MSNKPKTLFLRRLAAFVYDLIVTFALLLLATLIPLLFTHGHSITPNNHFFQLYLTLIIGIYYMGFWLRGGQTLGMLAWDIKLTSASYANISIRQVVIRFIFAVLGILLFGLGFISMLLDKEGLALYDRISKTKIIRIKKEIQNA